MDVFAGSTCCPALVNGYLSNQSETMDAFHQNGAVPGFFCYPVDGFTGAERGKVLLDFRDALEEAVRKAAGEDAVTFWVVRRVCAVVIWTLSLGICRPC